MIRLLTARDGLETTRALRLLRPFWNYYGGKWRAALRYPAPRNGTIIEPFAGSAGYALRYYQRDVVLVEKYGVVAEMWRYLITAPPAEILRIPCVDDVAELPSWVPAGGRALVGFAMNGATTAPRRRLSSGRRRLRLMGRAFEGWTPARRARTAAHAAHVRHWKIIEGDYKSAPNLAATWFIDPPYQDAGVHYVHGSGEIDYTELADWCRARPGQVIVCEAEGAAWLPFRPLAQIKSSMNGSGVSREAIWERVAE